MYSKEFEDLIREYDRLYSNPQKQFEILQRLARIAKTPQEKLVVNAKYLQLKKDHGVP